LASTNISIRVMDLDVMKRVVEALGIAVGCLQELEHSRDGDQRAAIALRAIEALVPSGPPEPPVLKPPGYRSTP